MEPLHIFINGTKEACVVNEFIKLYSLNDKELIPNEYGLITFLRSDIEFSIIGQHELEDDFGIPFTQYPIQIYLYKMREGEPYENYESQYLEIAKYLTEKLAKKLDCKTMLVKNLSKQLISY